MARVHPSHRHPLPAMAPHLPIPIIASMRRGSGFSMIELLVVVTIIVVLAGLLLPALGTVRSVARSAQCLSNLRQIGMAQLGFANDNAGSICPADGHGWSDKNRFWNIRLADYTDDNAKRQTRSNHINSVTWGCPEWRQQEFIQRATAADSWSYLYTDSASGYAMSAAFTTGTTDNVENGWWYIDNNHYNPVDGSATARWNARDTDSWPLLANLAKIPWPAQQPLACDGYMHFFHGWYQAYASANGRKLVIERHRGKGGVLYLDGHVGLLNGEEWKQAFWNPQR